MAREPARVVDYETRVTDVLDLRAFALAADLHSLTAAAKIMAESKATLSRRITRLEQELGTALLRRSSLGVEPTDEGLAYRLRIGHVLELLGDANAAAAHGGTSEPSGQLRITIPPGLANALAPALASFATAYPQVTLVVNISARFVDLVGEHFDVAVRVTEKLADSTLVARRVPGHSTEGIFVASPAYLARRPAPRRLAELGAHRIIALDDTGAMTTMQLQKRGSAEVLAVKLPVAIAGSDLGFLLDLAIHGAGIVCLPRLNVKRALEESKLVQVLASYTWPTVGLFLVHRGGPFIAPKVRAFVDHVHAALARR